eukprot:scaffold1318_cov362-Pavlova_lutheri.AAC.15
MEPNPSVPNQGETDVRKPGWNRSDGRQVERQLHGTLRDSSGSSCASEVQQVLEGATVPTHRQTPSEGRSTRDRNHPQHPIPARPTQERTCIGSDVGLHRDARPTGAQVRVLLNRLGAAAAGGLEDSGCCVDRCAGFA